jgi:hypothetical protein
MLNLANGIALAKIIGKKYDGEILYLDKDDKTKKDKDPYNTYFGKEFIIYGQLDPILNVKERSVSYIAGPSGSGKTTYAVNLIKNYKKIFPDKDFFLFSRTNHESDPAFKNMKINQVLIDQNLLDNPIDIEKELTGGCILLFDDCNTIQNDKLKKQIDNLIGDIMEVGRRMDITIIVTNHLVIPNERRIARTIMNEMQSLTVFPKSGSCHQISHALKTYYGLNKKQIENILSLPSRWVTINKNYPMYIIYEHGCFIL